MDLDRDAKRILDLASEAREPGTQDKARLEQKLAAMLGVGALAAAPSVATEAAHAASSALSGAKAAAGAKAASGTALKWWLSSAVIASAVTGYVALSNEPPAARPPRAPAPAVAAPAAPMPEPEPEPVLQEAPDAPAAERPARAVSVKKRSAASSLGEEIELLHRAQAAWRARDAGRAIALLDEHRGRFPRSELKLERDGLRVLSLCELGRKAEATSLARKLLDRAPRSPLRATIEESCALK